MVNQAKDIEDAILGTCLVDRFALQDIKETLKVEAFYYESNQWIYQAILNCKKEVDLLIVENELKKMGKFEQIGGVYLADLTNLATAQYIHYCNILNEKKLLRDISYGCVNINSKATTHSDAYEVLDELNRMVLSLDTGVKAKESLTPSEIFKREENTPKAEKLFTGFSQLDNGMYSDSMKRGQFELTIADSGHGKTHYAMWKAHYLLKKGYKVAWFQLEDYDVHTAMYMAINAPEQMDNIHICHSLYDIEDIKRECRMLKKEEGLDYIIFDYVQNIECGLNISKTEKVEYISKQLTKMAKDLNCVTHGLSQVTIDYNRRHGWAQEPSYGDVRWSQQLKQDAHIITSVFRPSKVEGLVEDTEWVKDFNGKLVPFHSVYVKQAKVRHGKQHYTRLHLMHHEDGLKPYVNY